MKISLTLGANSFTYEGEESPSDLFRLWLNAQQPGQDAIKLEALTEKLRANNTALETVVDNVIKGEV